jgi:hypothetical protein
VAHHAEARALRACANEEREPGARLVEILTELNPALGERAARLGGYARQIAAGLALPDPDRYRVAAALSVLPDATEGTTPAVIATLCAAVTRAAEIDEMASHQAVSVITAARQFDAILSRGADPEAAIAEMRRAGELAPATLDALESTSVSCKWIDLDVGVDELEGGMCTLEPVRSSAGLTLVPAGQLLTSAMVKLIRGHQHTCGVSEPVHVKAPCPATA